jgi:hypothetical protein
MKGRERLDHAPFFFAGCNEGSRPELSSWFEMAARILWFPGRENFSRRSLAVGDVRGK